MTKVRYEIFQRAGEWIVSDGTEELGEGRGLSQWEAQLVAKRLNRLVAVIERGWVSGV